MNAITWTWTPEQKAAKSAAMTRYTPEERKAVKAARNAAYNASRRLPMMEAPCFQCGAPKVVSVQRVERNKRRIFCTLECKRIVERREFNARQAGRAHKAIRPSALEATIEGITKDCLSCGLPFPSSDRRRIWVCDACKGSEEWTSFVGECEASVSWPSP